MTLATRTPANDSHAAASRMARLFGTSRVSNASLLDEALPQDLKTALAALPVLEQLEGRQLMAASIAGSTLLISGNAASANTFDIRISSGKLATTVNGATSTFTNTAGLQIQITGGTANDKVTIADNVTAKARIDTFAGNDSIKAGGGNDTVFAGSGTDSVNGGPGDDLAYDAEDVYAATAKGGAPTNTTTPVVTVPAPTPTPIVTAPTFPSNPVNSGSIRMSSGEVYVTGKTASANIIKVTLDATGKKLLVQSNADAASYNVVDIKWVRVTSGTGADLIDLASNVTARLNVHSGSGKDTIRGGAAADVIYSDNDNDAIDGRAGNDWINGGGGNDVVFGGTGADNIDGAEGNDSLDGGADNDVLIGGGGTDVGVSGESRQSIETVSSNSSTWIGTGSTGGGTTTPITPTPTPTRTPTPTPTPGTGGAIGAGTPPSTGNVSNPVARIISSTGFSITAGMGVHVDALSSTLNNGQPVTARYEWDFGDSGSRFNKLVGFNAAHVYDRAGTFTITLRVINEGGKTSTTTQQVNVAADNRRVIYVSGSGSDSNNGSISSPLRTFNAAAAAVGNASDVEVLFKRGETFNVSSTSMWIRGRNVTVSAYGSGAKPILKYVGPRNVWRAFVQTTSSAEDVDVNGLTFDSIYNSTDGSVENMPVALHNSGRNVTLRNNTMLDIGFGANVAAGTNGILVQDNESPKATGLRAYFIWSEKGSNIVALGNKVANSTREHIMRFVETTKVLVAGNDLTNLERNSGDQAKGVIVFQKGSYYYAANNKLNGPSGFGPLGLADGLGDKGARTVNGVFEGNYQTGAHFEVLHGSQNINIRNNVFLADDREAIQVQGYNNTYGRGSSNVIIANNTGINMAQTGTFFAVHTPVEGIKLINNLYIAPNLYAGWNSAGGIAVFSTGLSSFTRVDGNNWSMPNTIHSWVEGGINRIGVNGSSAREIWQSPAEWNAISQVGTDMFTAVRIDSSFRPYAGQSGLDGVSTGGVFVDYYGNYRPANDFTVGAVQI